MTGSNNTKNWSQLAWKTAALAGWGVVIAGAAGVDTTPKIGVVDASRVTSGSKRVQARLAEASSSVQPLNDQLKAKTQELEKATEAYSAQRTAATESENAARLEKLRKMREEVEELNFELSRAAKRAQSDTVMPMRDELALAVQKVAQSKGYTVALNKDQLFYYDPAIEITDEVIKMIDQSAAAPGKSEKKGKGK